MVCLSCLCLSASSVCGLCVFSAHVSIYVAVSGGLAQVSCKQTKHNDDKDLAFVGFLLEIYLYDMCMLIKEYC